MWPDFCITAGTSGSDSCDFFFFSFKGRTFLVYRIYHLSDGSVAEPDEGTGRPQ